MKIATFNINGIARRLPQLLAWLAAAAPDVVCLQELKVDRGAFRTPRCSRPATAPPGIAEGAYNGVAILTKGEEPIVTRRALPGATDDSSAATSKPP